MFFGSEESFWPRRHTLSRGLEAGSSLIAGGADPSRNLEWVYPQPAWQVSNPRPPHLGAHLGAETQPAKLPVWVFQLSHNRMVSVITRHVLHGTSSRLSPLPSHHIFPVSYHAHRRAANFFGKTTRPKRYDLASKHTNTCGHIDT